MDFVSSLFGFSSVAPAGGVAEPVESNQNSKIQLVAGIVFSAIAIGAAAAEWSQLPLNFVGHPAALICIAIVATVISVTCFALYFFGDDEEDDDMGPDGNPEIIVQLEGFNGGQGNDNNVPPSEPPRSPSPQPSAHNSIKTNSDDDEFFDCE